MGLIRRLPRGMRDVSDWAIWRLPRWLAVFVLAVIAANLAAVGVAAPLTRFRGHDLILFGVLEACTAIAVEWSRRAKEQHGMSQGRPGGVGVPGRDPAAPAVRVARPAVPGSR